MYEIKYEHRMLPVFAASFFVNRCFGWQQRAQGAWGAGTCLVSLTD